MLKKVKVIKWTKRQIYVIELSSYLPSNDLTDSGFLKENTLYEPKSTSIRILFVPTFRSSLTSSTEELSYKLTRPCFQHCIQFFVYIHGVLSWIMCIVNVCCFLATEPNVYLRHFTGNRHNRSFLLWGFHPLPLLTFTHWPCFVPRHNLCPQQPLCKQTQRNLSVGGVCRGQSLKSSTCLFFVFCWVVSVADGTHTNKPRQTSSLGRLQLAHQTSKQEGHLYTPRPLLPQGHATTQRRQYPSTQTDPQRTAPD